MLTTQAPAPSQPAASAAAPAAASPSTTTAAAPAPIQPAAPAAAPPEPAASTTSLVSDSTVVPDKFKVVRTDGTIDHAASLQKVLGGYTHLEKRLGSGDVPPETEDGYKLDYAAFPEGVKISPDGEKALLKSLHASGMTNKQVQTVINKYGEVIKAGLELQRTQSVEQVQMVNTELATSWGSEFEAHKTAAIRGFNHLADTVDKADLLKIGTDAKVTYRILMKVLAKVGAGIAEDTQVLHADGATLDTSIETLRASEAYLSETHKDHKTTVDKVTALYQKKYPQKK